jgi:anti-sigma B factor antagonist
MSFRVTESEQTVTVHLSGEIDLDRSPEARKALLAAVAKGRGVTVDMADVDYMDSSGIASLVEAFQRASSGKQPFELVRVGERVLKVLQLAKLDQVFRIAA